MTTTIDWSKCKVFIGGREIEASVEIFETSAVGEQPTDQQIFITPGVRTTQVQVHMHSTPEQQEAWRKVLRNITRVSRQAKKCEARVDREFRRTLVRIAGSATIPAHAKRGLVQTRYLRAMGIRIPRSLR